MKKLLTDADIIEKLQKELSLLQEKNNLLQEENAELSAKLNWFEEQFRLSQHRLYGRSSEKTVINEQISLFNEAEALSDVNPEVPEPSIEEITYKRKKRKGHREEMLKDLPVEVIEYKLSEDELFCENCNSNLHEIRTEVRKELEVIPATVKVIEHVRYIYGCRNCDNNGIDNPIVTTKMPEPPIPKSIASASTIAHVMVQKFMFGLPLYRQEQQWKQLDLDISRQTMSNWLLIATNRWLHYIYERMHYYLLQKDIICADETEVQVLHEPGRAATTNSYMWVYRTGRDGPPIVLFEYQTTRAGKHPKKFLENFKSYLCTDGYAGYNSVPSITRICCFVHARRKFDEALKVLPKTKRTKTCAAQEGLDFCNKLFDIEKDLKEVSVEERYALRLEKSKPVLDDFYSWLKIQRKVLTPKSATGNAVQYCLNLWDKLCGFLLDGRLYIDNNITERSIKSFVISRKNFLFCNTPSGATASAIIYSIIQTARENNLKPFEYLKYLLHMLPNSDVNDQKILDLYLPWSKDIPEVCKFNNNSI
ncbi:UNVERIFIED_CONTAM: transposase [Acetivibrio alkalicellulosi]